MDIPSALLCARRVLEDIQEYTLLHDLEWEPTCKKWYLKFSITIDNTMYINKVTYWVVVLDDIYPKGDVEVYPDAILGITNTYPHQSNNGLVSQNGIWRKGKLCLEVPMFTVASKPKEDEWKLHWFILRTVEWVNMANRSELLKAGDWFELPDDNTTRLSTIAYDEDEVSSMIWESYNTSYGLVELKEINNEEVFCVIRYRDLGRQIVYEPVWGSFINNSTATSDFGGWIMLNEILVINNWQSPNTFTELIIALKNQDIDLIEVLVKMFPKFRDGRRHFLLLGFPIPHKVGEEASTIAWKAILLPTLSRGNKYAKGFRADEKGWLKRDFDDIIIGNEKLDWVISENWNSKNILSRGRYEPSVIRSKYVVIGAGTLSSFICEQLVRNGVEDITIIDSDIFHAGNLSRHLLSIHDISNSKAKALANHLNAINSHARIKAINKKIKVDNVSILSRKNVIIDCTANDDVLKLISEIKCGSSVKFFSASFGFRADHLYILATDINSFHYESFTDIFDKTIQEDIKKYNSEDLPWEGIGCWSPVFPAKTSDVMLAAATAVEIITHYITEGVTTSKNFIYKKDYDEDGFLIGYSKINHEV